MSDPNKSPEPTNERKSEEDTGCLIVDGDEYHSVCAEIMQKDDGIFPKLDPSELYKLSINPTYHRTVYSYYFQVRDSLVLIPPNYGIHDEVHDPTFVSRRKESREVAMRQAEYLASRHLTNSKVIEPLWYQNVDSRLSQHPNADIAEAWTTATKTLNHYRVMIQLPQHAAGSNC